MIPLLLHDGHYTLSSPHGSATDLKLEMCSRCVPDLKLEMCSRCVPDVPQICSRSMGTLCFAQSSAHDSHRTLLRLVLEGGKGTNRKLIIYIFQWCTCFPLKFDYFYIYIYIYIYFPSFPFVSFRFSVLNALFH